MSNRYSRRDNHRGHDGGKGSPQPQQKFVPKPQQIPSPFSLSDSLRHSGPSQSNAPPSSSATIATTSSSEGGGAGAAPETAPESRVRMGKHGDYVPTKIQVRNFLNYLPQDEAVAVGLGADQGGLDPVESQRVVDLLNLELSGLLKLNPRDFWKEVATDASLHDFLESFLKFRSRWYDFPYRGAKGVVAGVVVGENELSRRVFMVLYRISSNRDPGAKAADCLSSKDHGVILQRKMLLDLPKLLDICAVYSHENEDLTRNLVLNAIKAQPWINDDLTGVMSHFLNIVNTMYHRCNTSLEVLLSSGSRQDHEAIQLHADYLEVMDFLNDAVIAMDAFVSAYSRAATFFCCPVETTYGTEELLKMLARLNDSLLPSLQQGFQVIYTVGDGNGDPLLDMSSEVAISLKMLSSRILKFGWNLLYYCYLNDEVSEETSPSLSLTKIFPSQVEDPIIRADILVQTFREISEECSTVWEGKSKGTFLLMLEKNHSLLSRIKLLIDKGWISMDEEQMLYLSTIMLHHRRTEVPPISTNSNFEMNEDSAIMESKISQVKDLFPDYGKGFISTCLEVHNQDPEEVIQRILEGTLHEDLSSLDTSLDVFPSKPNISMSSRYDKGKGKLTEPTREQPSLTDGASKVHSEGPTPSSSSSPFFGRFIRKSTNNVSNSEILDSRDEIDTTLTATLASQFEYEDEYDDSFDDLGLSVGDTGLDDTEMNLDGKIQSFASSANKWGSRQRPQFFVKDGKNYSYKVTGSTAVANYNEALIVNSAQKELIHGLGLGGNIPVGAAQRLANLYQGQEEHDFEEQAQEGFGRGRRGGKRGSYKNDSAMSVSKDGEEEEKEEKGVGGRGRGGGRGKRGGGRSNHYRKDQAMKKHFSGLSGY